MAVIRNFLRSYLKKKYTEKINLYEKLINSILFHYESRIKYGFFFRIIQARSKNNSVKILDKYQKSQILFLNNTKIGSNDLALKFLNN